MKTTKSQEIGTVKRKHLGFTKDNILMTQHLMNFVVAIEHFLRLKCPKYPELAFISERQSWTQLLGERRLLKGIMHGNIRPRKCNNLSTRKNK